MADNDDTVREIRINPIVPSESVLVATARGMRPGTEEKRVERNAEAHVDRCPFCIGNEDKTPQLFLQNLMKKTGRYVLSKISTLFWVMTVAMQALTLVYNRPLRVMVAMR